MVIVFIGPRQGSDRSDEFGGWGALVPGRSGIDIVGYHQWVGILLSPMRHTRNKIIIIIRENNVVI
jgi:hypothetical protein